MPRSRTAPRPPAAPPATSEPGRRRTRLALLTLAGGCLLGALLMEAAVRALGIRPERFPRPRWQVLHNGGFIESNIWGGGRIKQPSRFQSLGVDMGEYVPGAVFKCVYPSNPTGYFDPDGGVTMSIDRWGLRTRLRETAREKPAGTYRILLLGDSFTFGVGVRDADTFAQRMEERLNADRGSAGPRIEVLNAGVQGYNTRDEVLYLEKQWLAFQPDLVLVVFYVNDAYNDGTILNNGEALGVYLEQPAGLARVSRVWDLVQHKRRARRASREVEAFYQRHFFANARDFLEHPGPMQVDWTVSKQALARAAELSKEKGFKLGLAIFPELYYLDGRHPFLGIYGLVNGACGELKIPTLDLFETTFRGRNPRELWVHPADHHPNALAHRLAGDALAGFVEREWLDAQE